MDEYSDAQRSEDFRWYIDNLLPLYMRYGEKFVAIKNKTILGVYDTFAEACDKTCEYQEPGTFIVQELGPDESVYKTYMSTIWA